MLNVTIIDHLAAGIAHNCCKSHAVEGASYKGMKMPIALYIDDNYHYQDAEYRSGPTSFEDVDAALAKARSIVDGFLTEACQPNMSANELFEHFKLFGPDPWIVPGDDGPTVPFSAWNYARERCREICTGASE